MDYRADYISQKIRKGKLFECSTCYQKRRCPISIDAKFGRWTVIREDASRDNHHRYFWARCDCGAEKSVVGTNLIDKTSRSCGCLARKLESKWVNKSHYPPSHGLRSKKSTRFLKLLYATRNRICAMCYRKENVSYPIHGENGHTVCDLWRNGAKDFVDWALEKGYKKGDAITIKEGEKEWGPQNCYVIRKRELMREKNSKFLTWKGKSQSLTDWAAELGVTISCISARLKKYAALYGLDRAMDMTWVPGTIRSYGTEHHEEDVISLYQSGHTFAEIKEKIGCEYSTVNRFLKKHRIPKRAAKTRSSLEVDRRKREILYDFKNGISFSELEKKYKNKSIRYYINKWNKEAMSFLNLS